MLLAAAARAAGNAHIEAKRVGQALRAAPRSTSPRHSAAPPRSRSIGTSRWPGGGTPRPLQTSRSSLGGRSQRRPALVAGNRPPKPDHSMSAPNPTQHGTMRRSGSTKTGNELGAARSNMSEPYMPTCTTNPAVPAMIKQPTPCKTASGRHAIRPDEGAIGRTRKKNAEAPCWRAVPSGSPARPPMCRACLVSCESGGAFCTTLGPGGQIQRAVYLA